MLTSEGPTRASSSTTAKKGTPNMANVPDLVVATYEREWAQRAAVRKFKRDRRASA